MDCSCYHVSPRLERAKGGMVGESDRLIRVTVMSYVLQARLDRSFALMSCKQHVSSEPLHVNVRRAEKCC